MLAFIMISRTIVSLKRSNARLVKNVGDRRKSNGLDRAYKVTEISHYRVEMKLSHDY
jgi:hypothetical protein